MIVGRVLAGLLVAACAATCAGCGSLPDWATPSLPTFDKPAEPADVRSWRATGTPELRGVVLQVSHGWRPDLFGAGGEWRGTAVVQAWPGGDFDAGELVTVHASLHLPREAEPSHFLRHAVRNDGRPVVMFVRRRWFPWPRWEFRWGTSQAPGRALPESQRLDPADLR